MKTQKQMTLFDSKSTNGNLTQYSNTTKSRLMGINIITETLEQSLLVSEQVNFLIKRVEYLEQQQKNKNYDGWMTLEQASQQLGKTVAAIRQKIKHKKQPMPEGIVWKQHSKFAPIYVNLRAYREHM